MDDESPFESHSEPDEPGPFGQHTGAFFSKAQNFVVTGGKFKSITNITHAAPTVPSDFRMIPMGDLDLRHEIRQDCGSGVANRRQEKQSLRRMYSVRIHGFKSKMTVALYQGENAEGQWRQAISRGSCLRHPNFVQLYATASSSGIHAAVFHDDLMSWTQILDIYRDSHFSIIAFYRFLHREFFDVDQYMHSVFAEFLSTDQCTMWIRCSTGRLCIDLTPPEFNPLYFCDNKFGLPPSFAPSALKPPEDSQIIESTPLGMYHEICSIFLSRYRTLPMSPGVSVQIGTIISCAAGGEIEPRTMMGSIPHPEFQDSGWSWIRGMPMLMADGWVRLTSSEIEDGPIRRRINSSRNIFLLGRSWVAQASYIFDRIEITCNYDDYVVVDEITAQLTLSNTSNIPSGYLFLCPLRDLQSEIPSQFRLPECPAYWSLDSSGGERLSPKEAAEFGFPRLEFKMEGRGCFFAETVYTGIRQFYQAKGYDPCGQDVAQELGYPLFQISSELEGQFAHVEDTESCGGDEQGEGVDTSGALVDGMLSLVDETEDILELSRSWKIVMGGQLVLILLLSLFCLYESFQFRVSTS